MNNTDLTQRPPRSPRVKLGGYVLLPRMLDKGRATIAGKAGEYHYACPLDQRLLQFTGLDKESILDLLKAGKSDSEVLAWVREKAPKADWEIAAWSRWVTDRAPSDAEGHRYVAETAEKAASERDDIATYFDMLDLDDYVSFGGQG
jgi:hypothetical protein